MQDSLEFIKKMWGGMGVPGMVVPTLSVEEINKKISDLKAVESWLNLNLNMLRTTIQALEVQSATISALQAMAAANQAGVQASTDRQDGSGSESGASAWATSAGFPFSFMSPAKNAPVAPDPAVPPEAKAEAEAENPPSASGAADNSLGNSGAWWDLLQNQFKQAVNSVVAAEKMVMPAKAATDSEAKPAVKPRSKAGNGTASKSAGKKSSTATAGKTTVRSSKAKAVPKE